MPVCILGGGLGHLQLLRRETGEDREKHFSGDYTLETGFKDSALWHLSGMLPNPGFGCFSCWVVRSPCFSGHPQASADPASCTVAALVLTVCVFWGSALGSMLSYLW